MGNRSNIELHRSKTDWFGIHVKNIEATTPSFTDSVKSAHRDDHYTLYVQHRGYTKLIVDFKGHQIEGKAIFFILPGQVHNYIEQIKSEGYILFIEPAFINKAYRAILDDRRGIEQSFSCDDDVVWQTVQLIFDVHSKICKHGEQYTEIEGSIIRSLVEALLGMVISASEHVSEDPYEFFDRKTELSFQFRNLVKKEYLNLKKPKDYALILNVSVSYVNEAVKKTTGFTSGYWIEQEILLEAKRLLSFTQLNAKEIAFYLGYEDYAYFSRFFKKNVGTTPLGFRKQHPG